MLSNCKIVALGGGTGLSTVIRGLKHYTPNITAVVTMADNGGGSGILRQEMKMLPPGDIRNCILALANTEPILKTLFQYRFNEGSLEGQSFGNIFLAAMNGISGSFELAVERVCEVLAVTGQVLPVTLDDVNLCASYENDIIIQGETQIVEYCKQNNQPIKSVFLRPTPVKPNKKVIKAIEEADTIILGPGSLYTSIIPNLLVDGIVDAITKRKTDVIYISNIMTQPGETDNMNLQQHIDIIKKYLGSGIINKVVVNNEDIPISIFNRYKDDGSEQVKIEMNYKEGIDLIQVPLVKIEENELYIRHDEKKLAEVIINL